MQTLDMDETFFIQEFQVLLNEVTPLNQVFLMQMVTFPCYR